MDGSGFGCSPGSAIAPTIDALTKSRRYSTTFKALREAREQHVHAQLLERDKADPQRQLAESPLRRASFSFAGIGHVTAADALLAANAAQKAREHRRLAAEERHRAYAEARR